MRLTVFLACSHHATTKQLNNLASVKLDDPHCVVPIIVLSYFLNSGNTAVIPTDVTDFTTESSPKNQRARSMSWIEQSTKIPPQNPSIFDEESRRVKLVTSLRTENAGTTDESILELLVRVTVGKVKAAREDTDNFLRGVFLLILAVRIDD
jgi:hypothetical protein